MKKIFVLAAICSALAVLPLFKGNPPGAQAAGEDDYNAYIVAAGAECLTAYYTQVGDGNATMTFDLQYRSAGGYFGVIAGASSSLGKLSAMTDYMLFGDTVLAGKPTEGKENIFEAGCTYRVKFDAKNSVWSVDKKTIGDGDAAFSNVLTLPNGFTSSNVVGLACYTKDERSATAVIDNLLITNNSGKTQFVNNPFSGSNSIKDGSMKTLVTNAVSGESVASVKNYVYIQDKWLCNVRFMAENGDILSEGKVSVYGTANAPAAPAKERYVFKGWSGSTTGILTDCVLYPVYEEKKTPDDPAESVVPDASDKTSDSAKPAGKGCKGSAAPLAALPAVFAVAGIVGIGRRKGE